jgi:hypothetical protein
MYEHKCNYPVLLLLLKNGELICAINAQTVYLNKLFSKLKLNFYLFIRLVEIKKKKSLLNAVSFIKFLQGEEGRFHHMYIQFIADLGARGKQLQFNILGMIS